MKTTVYCNFHAKCDGRVQQQKLFVGSDLSVYGCCTVQLCGATCTYIRVQHSATQNHWKIDTGEQQNMKYSHSPPYRKKKRRNRRKRKLQAQQRTHNPNTHTHTQSFGIWVTLIKLHISCRLSCSVQLARTEYSNRATPNTSIAQTHDWRTQFRDKICILMS